MTTLRTNMATQGSLNRHISSLSAHEGLFIPYISAASFVPYVSAISSVDLGMYDLDANRVGTTMINITGTEVLYHSAIGGIITYDGEYTIHTFLSSSVFETDGYIDAEVLVVAGGAGATYNGGAGAGGLIHLTSYNISPSSYNVTIGLGGLGGDIGYKNGNPSIFSSLTAIGGGAPGYPLYMDGTYVDGQNGGSGGGASRYGSIFGIPGQGTLNQGFSGGNVSVYSNGGGGGAGGPAIGPISGPGYICNITGTSTSYASGGMGYGEPPSYTPVHELPNTGNGGSAYRGNGGSGIVVIRYKTITLSTTTRNIILSSDKFNFDVGATFDGPVSIIGTDVAPATYIYEASGGTITRNGDYTIHTFLSSGTFYTDFDLNTEVLVVGGGGGASWRSLYWGGGGGGGLIHLSSVNVPCSSYTVEVGIGGGATNPNTPLKGGDSFFFNMSAIGGGHGGVAGISSVYGYGSGGSGGSGGGGYSRSSTNSDVQPGGSGVIGQGFVGGNAAWWSGFNIVVGGSGGGAGGAGITPIPPANEVAGGAGYSCNITGTYKTYAAGGQNYNDSPTPLDLSNTGTGANNIQYSISSREYNGGSGIVVIKYLRPTIAPPVSTITRSISLSSNEFQFETGGTFRGSVKELNNGTVQYTSNNIVSSINIIDSRNLIFTRNAAGFVTSMTDNINTWTYVRDSQNKILSWSYT